METVNVTGGGPEEKCLITVVLLTNIILIQVYKIE
jgi:hypothetical protein